MRIKATATICTPREFRVKERKSDELYMIMEWTEKRWNESAVI